MSFEGSRRMVVVLIAAITVPVLTAAQIPEERAAARNLAATRGPAVVMVLATVKTPPSGRGAARDVPIQTNATVIEPNGLAVMPLSAIDAGSLMAGRGGPAGPAETADLRMRTADGRELPARVVLRDPDLDLVFIRPVDPPAAPMTAADGPAGTPSLMDLVVVLQRTSESSGWTTWASFAYVQMVIDRPRPYYVVPTATLYGGGLGSPVFDPSGRFLGIMARIGGARTNPQPAVVPAEDIREIAKQAAGK